MNSNLSTFEDLTNYVYCIINHMLDLTPPNYEFCPFCGRKLDTRIEEEKERMYCPDCAWTYYPHVGAAACAVIVKDDTVLMVKRKREPYAGTWMFPAGFVDYGEHPEDTLKREVSEETGLRIQDFSFISIYQVDDDPRAMGHWGIFYKVIVEEGTLKNDEEENEDLQWFDISAIPEIGWHTHKDVGEMLKRVQI